MANLAIKGHSTRGKEVIDILEMLGGNIRRDRLAGNEPFSWYYINGNGYIDYKHYSLFDDTTVFTIEEFLERYPYKVGDKVSARGSSGKIIYMRWQGDSFFTTKEEGEVVYTVMLDTEEKITFSVEDLQPYKEETMESNPILQQLKEYFDNTPRDVIEKEWEELSHLNEIGPTVSEYLASVKKYRQSNQYPKTYEECCKVLKIPNDERYIDIDVPLDYNKLLSAFTELLICCDAYWKIAGEQLGLGKPWSPSKNDDVYCIFRLEGEIVKDNFVFADSLILEFPTEEMRDAFYENFKDLIEQCKKLL